MFDLDFLRPKEKFLLLEIAPKRTSGLLISVDEEKHIRPEKFWDEFSFNKLSRDPLKVLRNHKIVVSAHPSFATTISMPVELEREGGEVERPIGTAELENIFAKAVSVFFGKYRSEVSKRLGLNELEVVLVETTASNFRVDGHLVLNPVGFRGRKIAATLEFVFAARNIFDDLKPFFNSKTGFFFTPSSRASAFALSRADSAPATLVFLDSDGSYYVVFSEFPSGRSVKEEKLDWSFSHLLRSISAAAGTGRRATFDVYHRYLKSDASPGFLRVISRVVKPELEAMLKKVKEKKPVGAVYVYSPLPLPLSYPVRLLHGAEMKEPQLEQILGRFGFTTEPREWQAEKGEIFPRLAPFLESYFDKSDSEVNKRLKRRLHWLIQ